MYQKIYSKFLALSKEDLYKGMFIAFTGVLLGALQQAVTAHGFDVRSYDWGSILSVSWKAAGLYLVKNFLTDENGQVLGMRLGVPR